MNRSTLLMCTLVLVPSFACSKQPVAGAESLPEPTQKHNDEPTKEVAEPAGAEVAADAKPQVFTDCKDATGGDEATLREVGEAKNAIGAIARGALMAYEREQSHPNDPTAPDHLLCKSAVAVPAAGVPKGANYQPNFADDADYQTGDATTGWRCLKFSVTSPQRFQYGYNVGSGYKSPAFGLPDPGPNGFEAWAMGDLDGDGHPSLFVVTGTIKSTGELVRNRTMACVDPFE